MLAEASQPVPPYHQQFHYPMASVTPNVTTNSYNHLGFTSSQQATPPPPPASSSSTYGKEIEQLESLAIALCSQEIIEACQSLDISQGKDILCIFTHLHVYIYIYNIYVL